MLLRSTNHRFDPILAANPISEQAIPHAGLSSLEDGTVRLDIRIR